MLSVATVRSAAGAASYFAADNYYTAGEALGEWFGKGAEALGLSGRIEASTFEALLKGELPDGSRVGREGVHRAGVDLTFSLPKSWSLLALVGGDKRIIQAYTDAVKATLSWAEKNAAQARIDVDGREQLVPTGNLVVGLFEHDTSRAQEPQAHVHAVVANVTQMPDGSWRALRNDKLWSLNTLLNSITMATFRQSVEALGYQIGDLSKHGNFEAAGIARNVVMAFSTRRQQILAKVAELRSASPQALQAATLMTRENKAPVADRAALYEGWQSTAREVGLDLPALIAEAAGRGDREPGLASRLVAGSARIAGQARDLANGFAAFLGLGRNDPYLPRSFRNQTASQIAAAHAVASAIHHLEQREAGFEKTDLYKAALDFGLPTIIAEVEAAVDRRLGAKDLLPGNNRSPGMVTTANAIATEQRILDGINASREAVAPILAGDKAAQRLQELGEANSGRALNAGQEAAGRLMFASTDRIVAVQGVAGAGKSTVLEPAARLMEESGRKVIGLAVQNTLVRMLERETGIEAMTVTRFLKTHSPDGSAPSLAGHVLLVDEASMLANADQLKLIEAANRLGADRLVFIGDRKQLGAVDAGKPFALAQQAGIATAVMDENVRARTDVVRTAASAAQSGDVKAAMEALGGNIVETSGDGVGVAAAQWLALSPAERERTMIFASGRRLRDGVNLAVQVGLKAEGTLGGAALALATLDRVNLTDEQLRYSHHYQPSRIVEIARPIDGQRLPPGLHTVQQVDSRDRVTLRGSDGKDRLFRPIAMHSRGDARLAIYERKDQTIYAGDRIRWTATDHERGLLNADRATVLGIDKSGVAIETAIGVRMTLPHGDLMLRRLDLAYAFNAHMAQGMTVDRGIVVMESRDTRLLTQQNFLVSLTRVREALTLVVDQTGSVAGKIARSTGEKASALETTGKLEGKAHGTRPAPEKSLVLTPEPVKPFEIGI